MARVLTACSAARAATEPLLKLKRPRRLRSTPVTRDRAADLANAAALGNALLAFLVVPWTFTLALYTGVHARRCMLSSGAAGMGRRRCSCAATGLLGHI